MSGIPIPATLRPERFCAGFAHGLRGGQLDHVEYSACRFRMGFRSASFTCAKCAGAWCRRISGTLAHAPARGRTVNEAEPRTRLVAADVIMPPIVIRAILTDIEGTTSSLSFVKDVLVFPYARERLAGFVQYPCPRTVRAPRTC